RRVQMHQPIPRGRVVRFGALQEGARGRAGGLPALATAAEVAHLIHGSTNRQEKGGKVQAQLSIIIIDSEQQGNGPLCNIIALVSWGGYRPVRRRNPQSWTPTVVQNMPS